MRILLLLLLLSTPALADTLAETLYLHASDVNLRSRPSTRADVVGKISIGQACEAGDTKQGWVELTCGSLRGFTLRKFLETAPPDFDALMREAADAKATPRDRYTAATRAAALRTDDARARAILRETFLLAELSLLEKLRAKGRTRAVKELKCPGTTLVQCIDAHVAKRHAVDWVRTLSRGAEFVTAVRAGDSLRVARGTLKGGHVIVEATSFYAAGSALDRALAEGAMKGTGKEAVLDQTSVEALEPLLEPTWVPVRGTQAKPVQEVQCGASSFSYGYDLDVVDGLVASGGGAQDMIQDSNLFHISRARRTGQRVSFTWRTMYGGEGDVDVDVELPARKGEAARWTFGGDTALYAAWIGDPDAAQAFKVNVDDCRPAGCPDGPTPTPELVGDWHPGGEDGWTFNRDNTITEMGPDAELGCWRYERGSRILTVKYSFPGRYKVSGLTSAGFTATNIETGEVIEFKAEHN